MAFILFNQVMVFVSNLLKKINSPAEAPPDSYILYNLENGIYYVNARDFPNFSTEWIELVKSPSLTMDLTYTPSHSIILDLDLLPTSSPTTGIFHIIETVLKMTFLPAVSHFTYIIAMRARHQGIHVHLPEFKIGHDDYILFCEMLQQKFRQALIGHETHRLDIPMNLMLPNAAKPNTPAYAPVHIVYVDENCTHHLTIMQFNEEFPKVKSAFPKRKNNAKSLFRSLLNLNNFKMLLGEIKYLMMPVIYARTNAPVHTILYATSIGMQPNQSSDWQDVATFTFKKSKEAGYICKAKEFSFNGANMKVFHHLRLNACNMEEFTTNNHAIKRWFERFGQRKRAMDAHIPEMFRDLHETLQFEHMILADNPNPIKTIMQYKDGYYFLPVFYALCQHFQVPPQRLSLDLRDLLDTDYYPFLEKVGAINAKNMHMTDFSINTVHFCANNLHPKSHLSNQEKLTAIVENNQRAILSVTTLEQMYRLLRSLQERHLPIHMFKLKNALKKPNRYVWNALTESWQEVTDNQEIKDHMQNLWTSLKKFCTMHRESGAIDGPEKDITDRVNIATVVSTIMSDSAMERKDIQMDLHKWLLRLQDGVLDLLTGHIGGVVPEFFISDRKVTLDIPRQQMMLFCNRSQDHESLYDRLVEKSFFQQYLLLLCSDQHPTLMDALLSLIHPSDDLARSMLHFYVNLCKFTSFEYSLLLFMLDVLASVFIGTNYMRKFIVWKGLTRNGKSKLFEMMGRVLGGYYYSIQSENLAPGHSANNATPELASTLFSCRMVATEELEKRLDENRVKQITGNSFVTFRNMYEPNSGGIPTAKIFASTNNYPECKGSEAFKDRILAIPFEAEFSDTAPTKTSEQIQYNTFAKEVHVVEQSYKGCFFMLYYHLKKNMHPDDRLLYYRKVPEIVVEFTEDYLIPSDIYVQFKLHMDVQLKAGFQTTYTDVKSAVRQYLKTTRNTSFQESDLTACFEREFGHLRQTDVQITSSTFNYMSVMLGEEEVEDNKRRKLDNSLIFYDGVVIKNLRRQNLDD